MQQVRVHGAGKFSVDEVMAPEPGPRDVIVRVQACGICGSDLGYVADGIVGMPTPGPSPLGHEFSAVIDRVGSEVRSFAPGSRVVVNPVAACNSIGNGGDAGAFSPEVLVRDVELAEVLFPIPDELPFDQAALAEPLGVGMHAVEQAEVAAGEKVAIFGAGPIGLMALATLRYRGIDDVAIVDLSDTRLEIARQLGATLTLNPSEGDIWPQLRELHGQAMFMDVVPMNGTEAYIEASGSPLALEQIIANARPDARIALVALHKKPEPINLIMVMAKQLTLRGSMCYPDDYGQMVRMLTEVDLSAAITHRFPLSAFEEAFATARDPNVAGKVIVLP